VEGSRSKPQLILVLAWILSFSLAILSLEMRALYGRSSPWALPVLLTAGVAALIWHHYQWKSEYQTVSLVGSVWPVPAGIAFVSLLAFAFRPSAKALAFGLFNIGAFLALWLLLRLSYRRIEKQREWETKLDAELEGLDTQAAVERLRAEAENIVAESGKRQRVMGFLVVAVVALGAVLIVVSLLHR
jgi:hypothetical protein